MRRASRAWRVIVGFVPFYWRLILSQKSGCFVLRSFGHELVKTPLPQLGGFFDPLNLRATLPANVMVDLRHSFLSLYTIGLCGGRVNMH